MSNFSLFHSRICNAPLHTCPNQRKRETNGDREMKIKRDKLATDTERESVSERERYNVG